MINRRYKSKVYNIKFKKKKKIKRNLYVTMAFADETVTDMYLPVRPHKRGTF